MNWYEEIRNMTPSEMLDFLWDNCGCGCCSRRGEETCNEVKDCRPYIKEWLESEVKPSGDQIV